MSNILLKPVSVTGKVRFGARKDGGYVVYEKLLSETDILMTYGIGTDVSFEEDFNASTGKRVLMFDPTIFWKISARYNSSFPVSCHIEVDNAG